MTTAEMIRMSTSFVSGTAINIARMGRLLREVLFFSLADERIAPKRHLSVLLESGGGFRRLSFPFLVPDENPKSAALPF